MNLNAMPSLYEIKIRPDTEDDLSVDLLTESQPQVQQPSTPKSITTVQAKLQWRNHHQNQENLPDEQERRRSR
jgi:hypothetical protein